MVGKFSLMIFFFIFTLFLGIVHELILIKVSDVNFVFLF